MELSTIIILASSVTVMIAVIVCVFAVRKANQKYDQLVEDIEQEKPERIRREVYDILRHRKKYISFDFIIAHTILWASVIASFASSILIATGGLENAKWAVAIFAGLPGLMTVIDKTFDFKRRSIWGSMYAIDLEGLKDEIEFNDLRPFEAATKLRKIKKRNEALFNRIGFFSSQKQEDSDGANGRNANDNNRNRARGANGQDQGANVNPKNILIPNPMVDAG